MSPLPAVVDKLVEQTVELVHPLRILVFGSVARGESRPESDIDLLVVMPEGTHCRKTAQRLYREVSGVGQPFDIIVTTAERLEKHRDNIGLVYHQALKEGREVYAV